jgi:hypothetical protein
MLCRRRMLMILLICPGFFFRKIHPQAARSIASLADALNAEAQASDPNGIHAYCEHLVELLVDGHRVGRGIINSLTDRLSNAEEMARRGDRSLVPEADIAIAFNDLMIRTGAPDSLRTDATIVHRFRLGPLSISPIPSLITLASNGTNCNPGEAVFLLYLLMANNGATDDRLPPGLEARDLPRMTITSHGPNEPNARRSLSDFASNHRRSDLAELFEHVAETLHL